MFGYQIAIFLAATIILPSVVGFVYFMKFKIQYKLIVILLLFSLFVELVMFVLPYLNINNLLVLHLYGVVEIILLSLFFIHNLNKAREKRIVRITMVGLSTFAIIYSIIGNNIAEFNSLPRAFECIYFSAISCYVFYKMTTDLAPEDESIYFVNGAILFYFSSCFIVFTFSKYLATDNNDLLVMHNVHSIVSAMCNISYATGLWIASKSSYSVA